MGDSRCRLLELPAELRIRIYEACLAPTGTLCLIATKTKRYATTPVLSPTILSTCRQIYSEAQDILLDQNKVCFTIDAHDTSWPVVSEKRLPQHVLEKLQHAVIILDAATTFYSSYQNIDWSALGALVSLKTLKICIVWQCEGTSPSAASWLDFYELMEQVLERIPQSTKVMYGADKDAPEHELVKNVIERRQQGRTFPQIGIGRGPVSVQELTTAEYAELEEVVGEINQGEQSGGVEDVYAEYRPDQMRMFSKTRVEPRSQLSVGD